MNKPFVPEDFLAPQHIQQDTYTLRPLTTDDVEKDFEAVMSSRESLRHVFFEYDMQWPADGMTIEDNYRDLQRHQDDFERRTGFTYTMETPDGERCLGCVYIYPSDRGEYDAQVHYWVRDSEKASGLEEELGAFLRQWLRDAWPFQNPAFPGRDVSWPVWEALPKTRS